MYASSDEPLPLRAAAAHEKLEAVLTSKFSLADGRAYDQFVATAPAGHYTQTRAWARVATAGRPFDPLYFLAHSCGKVIGAGLVLRTRFGGVPLPVAQLERGPVCANPEDLSEVLTALRHCCLERGILRLSVMPYWTGDGRAKAEKILAAAGFADSQRFAGRHARTLRLDLTALDPEKPWSASTLSKVRQNIGRASRAGASARPGRREDIAAFRAMQASLLAQEGKNPPHDAWYEALGDYFLGALSGKVPARVARNLNIGVQSTPGGFPSESATNKESAAVMFVCDVEGAPVSAIFITLHNGMATYALGATSGRLLKFSKTVLPMTQAILWARQAGAHTFDMGGVPMAGDSDAKRASIAEFKHSYSRTEVLLVHEHARWF